MTSSKLTLILSFHVNIFSSFLLWFQQFYWYFLQYWYCAEVKLPVYFFNIKSVRLFSNYHINKQTANASFITLTVCWWPCSSVRNDPIIMSTNSSSSYLHSLPDVSPARGPLQSLLPRRPSRTVALHDFRPAAANPEPPPTLLPIWLVHFSMRSRSFNDVRGLGHRTHVSLAVGCGWTNGGGRRESTRRKMSAASRPLALPRPQTCQNRDNKVKLLSVNINHLITVEPSN